MAKEKCKDCAKKDKDNFTRAFIVYQSSNEMTPALMHCFKQFIIDLENNGVLPYLTFQIGVPGCIPVPGRPCK